jgi:UDP-2,4-diacetamido-2,4,6-trideoxy-beta-L-altropyranose hydrolase
MNLLIRADADHKIGHGHIMRCFALGQTCKTQGGSVTFLSYCDSKSLRQRILDEGFEFIAVDKSCPEPSDLDLVLKIMSKINQQKQSDSWLVLDGYHFNSEYQRTIKAAGYRLLVVDDTAHLDYYFADIILNQNIYAKDLKYSRPAKTRLLLGSRYVLLRSEFIVLKDWKRQKPKRARHVLVTLGGADPDNVTLQIVNALKKANISDIEVTVVVGASNPNLGLLKAAVADKPFAMNIVGNVKNIADLMVRADVAVSAGGSTCWELAFMGVPSLVVVLAENQRLNAEGLEKAGFAINLGKSPLAMDNLKRSLKRVIFSDGLWAQMASNGQALIDGKGNQRVFSALAEDKVFLRKVREDDCKLLWEWANEKEVRKWSFSSEPIAWRDHQKWFTGKFKDPNCFHFIATDIIGNAAGQIRFDVADDTAEAHITIDRDMRGSGIGSRLLRVAVDQLKDLVPIKYIRGHVLPENIASIRVFKKAGFKKKEIVVIHGERCIRFEMKLNIKLERPNYE